ncbi:MAG: hypothetical protein QOK42_649 [Frankiaceae bacterium]|nr:hypothetical protein [Frankiaceae bacterium]MDX6273395.1 hypothetical protein [Frankiales bacterium]
MRTLMLVAGALLLVGCSSSGQPASAPTPPQGPTSVGPTGFHVAGSYETAVTLAGNTCKGITVQPNVTTVTHEPGSSSMTMTHAGQTYTGTVTRTGRFTTQPKPVDAGGGNVHTLGIAGGFSFTGFQARVSAVVTPENCRYTVIWVGTKDGQPNVLG